MEVPNNKFNISKYGVLAAVFTLASSIGEVDASAVNVVMEGGNVIITGLVASDSFRIFDLSGKLLYSGKTVANGSATVALPANKAILLSQGNVAIKVMR